MCGRLGREAVPPDVTVVSEGGVGEDGVGGQHEDGVRVRLHVRPGCHPEETRLRIDRPQHPIRPDLHPADVVADCLDLPVGHGRDEHGEVRLAAGGRKRTAHVTNLAGRGRQLEDQHVLGEPALVPRHD